jgi:L-ascorbate metabolism protein UlaG (beta-lactamase superfamily)
MKIKKIGHCCLVVEERGVRLLTDPGAYSTGQEKETDIAAVLITHEHSDHLHIESLKSILDTNPQAKVVTNSAVGKILAEQGVPFEKVEHGQRIIIGDLDIEGFGEKHAEIFEEFGMVQNTGYFIGDKLFYPGDAFTNPGKKIDVLALPVAGPWMKLSEAIIYARQISPKYVFPVHDGLLSAQSINGTTKRIPTAVLEPLGIRFIPMSAGDEQEF